MQHIHFLGQGQPALSQIASHILNQSPDVPDLHNVQVIYRDSRLNPALRRTLLETAREQRQPALLGPYFYTLEQWLAPFLPIEQTICDEQTRLLILVEALLNSPKLLKQANPWSLADSLLQLFDELTLNRIEITSDLTEFNNQLIQWYETNRYNFSGLQQEAELIHQLWFAWHEQLQAHGYLDPATAHILALDASLGFDFSQHHLHLVGIEPDSKTHQDWLTKILAKQNVHLWIQGCPGFAQGEVRFEDDLYRTKDKLNVAFKLQQPSDAYQKILASIFSRSGPLKEKARSFASQQQQSPLKDRVTVFDAHNAEQQVHAIELQVRRWLLEGKQHIGIVSENRLLARRLRALLERADIHLQDSAGWALATTRAAASIESLLLCIEEDFDKDALLDLLKSGLLYPQQDQDELKKLIYRLEHDIIHNEQITNNLARYKQAIINRQQRLEEIWSFNPAKIIDYLDALNEQTLPLQKLYRKTAGVQQFVVGLLAVLENLGISDNLQEDPAGQAILKLLDEMSLASGQQSIQVNWSQFRSWLSRNFESRYFQPATSNTSVRLFNLSQTDFENFDALVIAGLEQHELPGSPPVLQFFNNQVRQQLGLTNYEQFQEKRLRLFINLLLNAETILLTHRSTQDDEPVIASPWLLSIQQFHKNAYGDKLDAAELQAILSTQTAQVIRCDSHTLPEKQRQPGPIVPKALIPQSFSASSYQQLMNCPYQFFAAQCLQLKPPEEIQLALSKREYGERVHLCLQAFHSDIPHRPGPFQLPLTRQNRQQAIELMQEIASSVFKHDLQENYIHKGWYHQWLKVIPAYIDWHIDNKQNTTVCQTEVKLERAFIEERILKGRLDRIDKQDNEYEIIDYKTGQLPTKKDVLAGEQVQLPFYALLTDPESMPVKSVGYLAIGKDTNFKAMFPFEKDELSELANNVLVRLEEMVFEIEQGQTLPAWENRKACEYCDMMTLCRVGTWHA